MGTPAALLIINNEELIRNNVDYASSTAEDIFDHFVDNQYAFLARKHFDGHADTVVEDIQKMIAGQNSKSFAKGLEFCIDVVASNLILYTAITPGGKREDKKNGVPEPSWVPFVPTEDCKRRNIDGYPYVLILDMKSEKFILKRSFWDFDDEVLTGKPRYDLLGIEYKPTRPQDLTTDDKWYKMKRERMKAILDQCKANEKELEQIAENKIREIEENLKKESLSICKNCIVYPITTVNKNCNQPCDEYISFYNGKKSKILEWSREFYVKNFLKK